MTSNSAKREANRRWRAKHQEQVRGYNQRYRAEHREELREYDQRHYAEHQEEKREYDRRYRAAHTETLNKRPCVDCGKPCRGNGASPRCMTCATRHYRYKGGCITSTGYRLVGKNGQRYLEHRLVWEAVHGPLSKGEVVHHINGDRADNRLENLEAMPNTVHGRLHAPNYRRRKGEG